MKAKINQALGNIFIADAASGLNRANIQNTFMGHAPVATAIENRKIIT